ncbi:S1 RNA-binding domain-containing protein [Candidatus Woesearchaeota archaeon]|nr:MAG: S1 RNA-binding domain-containing protein [Candidatus Woesearchaeota archaeon]
MLYQKKGFPEESELVLCTVTKIQYHSVFVKLDEYEHTGMIHISEISPGRIRNIRDYVKEGKKIVCKVLRVDPKKRQIDLSLRRVSDGQRREKVNRIKQQQLAEKIVEFIAKKHGKDVKKLYDEIFELVKKDYEILYDFFEDYTLGNVKLEKGVPKSLVKEFEEIIKQRIKPKKISIGGTLEIKSYRADGVEFIKKVLGEEIKKHDNISVKYVGAGKYDVSVSGDDYKKAETVLKEFIGNIEKEFKSNNGTAEFVRKEK